jgi:hypothetical protein
MYTLHFRFNFHYVNVNFHFLWPNDYVFHIFNDKFSFKLLKIDFLLYNSADETTFDPKYGVNAVVNYDGDVCKN